MKTEQTSDLIGQGKVTWGNEQKVQFFLGCLFALLAGQGEVTWENEQKV